MTALIVETEPDIIEHEGLLIDRNTGEIMGLAGKPEFHVTDLSSAEWVLEKMDTTDFEIHGLRLQLAAIQERMESKIAEKQRRIDWFRMRYGSELEQFGREYLATTKAKTKTVKTPFGNIAFRTVKGRIKVKEGVETTYDLLDPFSVTPRIIKWAETLESKPLQEKHTVAFMVSKLPKDLTIEDLPADLFEQTPDEEKCDIKVGAR